MNFQEPLQDAIFFDFIHSVKCDADLGELSQAAKLIREQEPVCEARSARGGYHSPVYSVGTEAPSEVFRELIDGIIWYSSEFLENTYNREFNISSSEWWFMINGKGDYNVPHTHAKADLAAVFYVSAPERSGRIVLNRTDGSQYSMLPLDRRMEIVPEEGRLYLFPAHLQHWVEPSEVEEERISVVLNIYLHS